MGFLESLFHGVGLVLSSFSYIRHHKMSYVYICIIVLMTLLILGGMKLLGMGADYVEEWLESMLDGAPLPSWLSVAIKGLALIIMWLVSIITMSLFVGYTIIIILSPMFSHIAEKTYSIETGNKVRGGVKRFLYCLWRGIVIVMRNLVIQLTILLFLFIFGFVPLLGLVVPIVTLFINSYFFGLSMFDYSLEVRDMSIGKSLRYARGRRGLIVGIGLPFTILLMLPLIGTYIAVIFAPATVVATARAVEEQNKLMKID